MLQLYTQVEAFAAAINKLQELGFSVNTEESELVYRGTAGASSSWGLGMGATIHSMAGATLGTPLQVVCFLSMKLSHSTAASCRPAAMFVVQA